MYRSYGAFIIQGGTKEFDARGNRLTVESLVTVTPPCIGMV
jgi:hypothetical protein